MTTQNIDSADPAADKLPTLHSPTNESDSKFESDVRSTDHCRHCGQTSGVDETGFCCSGCELAYKIIRSQGLDEFYSIRENAQTGPANAIPNVEDVDAYVEYDSPKFWQENVRPIAGGLVTSQLRLKGIHCAACIWLLERLPRIVPGVIEARVNLPKATIELTWRPTQAKLSNVLLAIARLGYQAVASSKLSREAARAKENRQQLIQIAVAAACSANIMLLAIAMYAGEWTGMADDHRYLFRTATTIIGLIALLGPGSIFLRGAWSALRLQVPHMDVPVAVGLLVGAASGTWNSLRNSGELYFDSLAMLVFFLLIGRTLQSRQQQKASDQVDLLRQLTPRTARRIRDGVTETISSDELAPGDTVEVLPDRLIPADGTVIWGESEVDESLLTGESHLTVVRPRSPVISGSLNRRAAIRVRVERVGEKTRLGELAKSMESASLQKTPVVLLANRISGIFVVVVLIIATIVGLVWWTIDSSVWVDRVVAVLIVACPCALGLATPLAVAVGLSIAARRGILIKGGETLQRLAGTGTIFFDKTGTLTQGKLLVRQWRGPLSALEAAAVLESGSKHPVAETLRQYAAQRLGPERSRESQPAEEVQFHLGLGVRGRFRGEYYFVGSEAYLHANQVPIADSWRRLADQIAGPAYSVVWVASDKHVLACAILDDEIRSEAQGVLHRLQTLGWNVEMLSGDVPAAVANVARQIDLPTSATHAQVLPENKLQFVEAQKKLGQTVVMVGDGVNDAAALAAADIGIAVEGGAEVSLQAADVFLANGSLKGIESVIDLARRTMRIIRRNSIASVSYNVGAVTAAACGWLHPLAAAILMPISSLTVILVTLSGHRWRN